MMDILEDREIIVNLEEDKSDELDYSNGSESGYDDDEVFLKVVNGDNPPLSYSKEKLLHAMEKKRKNCEAFHYEDVGEDIYITISRKPNEDVGITLICGEVFTPSWPAIIDIKKNSAASEVSLKIGDQIKELLGIDTNTLTHWQLVALFGKESDDITMTVRRGLDRSQTTFDWYKHPFSSVRQDFEELVISDVKDNSPVHRGRCPCCHGCSDISRGRMALKTFKLEEDLNSINENHIVRHTRSLSVSSASKVAYANGIEKRRRHTNHTGLQNFRINGQHILPTDEGKFITNEIERIYAQKAHLEVIRQSLCDSTNSVSSTLSDSTASSFSSSSSTTYSDQPNGSQGNWMDHVMNSSDACNYNDEMFDKAFDKSAESGRNVSKSPGSKLRESFRRKKMKKETNIRESDDVKYTLKCKDASDNTLLLTVWIIDRRKMGLQLGGGSVSAYGDSNVKVTDIKKTGTAYKVFRVGDELLEIGGVTTNGLNVYDVNRMISNLEGQYVEFKIFRPKCY